MNPNNKSQEFLDVNGHEVASFASQVANVGFAHFTDLLVAMFKSGAWRKFQDGLGVYEFLPGEFDYFLTQQGVERDDVMHGVRDIETKAQLEAAMDERRTGEPGYRRHFTEVRQINPRRPGRPILPFGCTAVEAKHLAELGTNIKPRAREALGAATRRYTRSGGQTSVRPSDRLPALERATRIAHRLNDDDLHTLHAEVNSELERRRKEAAQRLPLDLPIATV